MNKINTLFWAATGLFCLWMLLNAFAYLTAAEAKRLCAHFGFPDYFRVELAVAKIIGVIILLIPYPIKALKEWAFAGFTITIVSGFIAHVCSGDSILSSASALLALGLLATSYYNYHQIIYIKNESSSSI